MRASVKEKLKGIELRNFDWQTWSSVSSKFSEQGLIKLFTEVSYITPNLGAFNKGLTLYLVDLKTNKIAYKWDLLRTEDVLKVAKHLFTICEKIISKECQSWIDGGLDQKYPIGLMEDVFMVRKEVASYLKLFRAKRFDDLPF